MDATTSNPRAQAKMSMAPETATRTIDFAVVNGKEPEMQETRAVPRRHVVFSVEDDAVEIARLKALGASGELSRTFFTAARQTREAITLFFGFDFGISDSSF